MLILILKVNLLLKNVSVLENLHFLESLNYHQNFVWLKNTMSCTIYNFNNLTTIYIIYKVYSTLVILISLKCHCIIAIISSKMDFLFIFLTCVLTGLRLNFHLVCTANLIKKVNLFQVLLKFRIFA